MDESITVYVNEEAAQVPPESTVLQAVSVVSAGLAADLTRGRGHVTDGTGRAISLDRPITAGSILRVVGVRPANYKEPG